MDDQRTEPAWRTAAVAAVALSVAVVGGLLADSALPLVATSMGVAVAAHSGRIGWRLSTAVVVLAVCALEVSLAWFLPHVPGSLATDNLVAWTLFGLVHVVLLARGGGFGPARLRIPELAAVLAVPAAVGAYLADATLTGRHPWVGWAMNGDAANNMILNRSFVSDGGLLRSQGNGAPLATVLHASWSAPGVDASDTAATVRDIVLESGELTLLLVAVIGVAASLMALQRVPARGPRRLAAAVAAGVLPWMWFVSGYVFAYGFQNATPGMLVLAFAWICWNGQSDHPVASVTGLILGTWAAAAAWGPVLLIPAAWFVVATIRQRRALRASGRALLLPLVTLLGAVAYALLVTLRDLLATGGVPGVDGSHPNLDPQWTIGLLAGLVVVMLVCHRWIRPDLRWGFWVALPAGSLAAYQLVHARDVAGLPLWGYYPIKYAWIVLSVVALVAFAEIVQVCGRAARVAWSGNGVLVALVLPVALMVQVAPPVATTLQGLATPVTLHEDVGLDAVHDKMFQIMEAEPDAIVSSYYGPPGGEAEESLTNFWLLQSAAADIGDPIRFPAYQLNARDVAGLCWAATVAERPLTIITRDETLERKLGRECTVAPGDYRVVKPAEVLRD
jgi:hypothetical protein